MKATIAVDIDDTLADTVHHFAREADKRFGNPEGLTPEEIIAKYRIMPNISYWQTPEIKQWLHDQAHINESQEAIQPIPGAPEALRKIAEHYDIVYITSRPVVVKEGTVRWLEKNGFPKGELVLNTTYDYKNGNAWKAYILEQNWPKYIGIIEDNPEIIAYLSRLYKGSIYLYGNAPLPETNEISVIRCYDWQDVINSIL